MLFSASQRSFTSEMNKSHIRNLAETLLKQLSNNENEMTTPNNKDSDPLFQEKIGKSGTSQINLESANDRSPHGVNEGQDEEARLKGDTTINEGNESVVRKRGRQHAKTDVVKKPGSKLFERSGLTLESFSEKTHILWSRVKGVVRVRSTVKRLSNIMAARTLNEKQIELIADLSHGKLENIRIPRLAMLPTAKARHLNKTKGPGRLKGLLTKYAGKKKDVQGEFFMIVMVIKIIIWPYPK